MTDDALRVTSTQGAKMESRGPGEDSRIMRRTSFCTGKMGQNIAESFEMVDIAPGLRSRRLLSVPFHGENGHRTQDPLRSILGASHLARRDVQGGSCGCKRLS